MQNRNTDERERRQIKNHRILLIEAHVGELSQDERNERRSAAARHHGETRTDQIPLVGRQIAEKSQQLFVAENREVFEHQFY